MSRCVALVGKCKLCIVCIAVLAPLFACGLSNTHESSNPVIFPATGSIVPQSIPPVSLKIVKDVYNGEVLKIQLEIVGEIDWSPLDTVLTLRTEREVSGGSTGESAEFVEISSITKRVSDLMGLDSSIGTSKPGDRLVAKGQSVSVVLPIKSESFTAYQLELLWGDDGKRALKKSPGLTRISEDPQQSKIELKPKSYSAVVIVKSIEREIQSCNAGSCQTKFTMLVQIENTGENTLPSVDLGVRYMIEGENTSSTEIKDGGTSQAADALLMEQTISIPNLNLSSRLKRSIKLKFNDLLPDKMVEKLRPAVRIREK